jgi:hypothetical protein
MPEGLAGQQRQAQQQVFTPPPELPWSEIGEDFIEAWGHDEHGKPRAEHWEIEGQSGSGKSYAVATALQQRAQKFDTGIIAAISKNTEDSLTKLDWPVVTGYGDVRKYRQMMFWPQTELKGEEREQYHEAKFFELLSQLWPDPGQQLWMVLYLDEIRYLEGLSRRLKKMIRMWWREGRSHGISIVAGAQRPLEMGRDMHSESRWRAVFQPSDEADYERFAQLLGPPKLWEPVLRGLNNDEHQFVLRNSTTKDAAITWIDEELKPLASQSAEAQRKKRQQHA